MRKEDISAFVFAWASMTKHQDPLGYHFDKYQASLLALRASLVQLSGGSLSLHKHHHNNNNNLTLSMFGQPHHRLG